MTTKEVEKKLREAAEQSGKHVEETRDERLKHVFERIELDERFKKESKLAKFFK